MKETIEEKKMKVLAGYLFELGNHTLDFLSQILLDDFHAALSFEKVDFSAFKSIEETDYKIGGRVLFTVEKMEHIGTEKNIFRVYVENTEVEIVAKSLS